MKLLRLLCALCLFLWLSSEEVALCQTSREAAGPVENIEELPAPTPMATPNEATTQSSPDMGLRSILEPTRGNGLGSPPQSASPPQLASPKGRSLLAPSYERGLAVDSEPVAIPRIRTPEGYEVLLQGPVHEAFGFHPPQEAVLPPLSPYPPPRPLQEQQPAAPKGGKNSQWVGGYWTWNELLNDFAWVPGMYREAPPGRVWRDGYWSRIDDSDDNYARVVGYWAEQGSSAQYLPPPPRSRDSGPSSQSRSPDSFWMPGHWKFQDDDYQWSEGFWTKQQAEWIWQPDRYVWTPKGVVYVSGFWDYEPTIRGLPYASIYFPEPVRQAQRVRFVPEYQIAAPSFLMAHLFVHPNDPQFHWGDYYRPAYREMGYLPWYTAAPGEFSSASLIGYFEWKFRRQRVSVAERMAERQQQWLGDVRLSRDALVAQPPAPLPQSNNSSPTAGWPNDFEGLIRGRNTSRIGSEDLSQLLAASLTQPSRDSTQTSALRAGLAGGSNRAPSVQNGVIPAAGSRTADNTPATNTARLGTTDRSRSALGRASAAQATPAPILGGTRSPSLDPRINPAVDSPLSALLNRSAAERAAANRGISPREAMRRGRLDPNLGAGPVIQTPFGPMRPPFGLQPPFGPPGFNPLRNGGMQPPIGGRRRFGRGR